MTEKEKQFNQWFDEYADGVKVFEEADMKQAYLQGRADLEKENAELKETLKTYNGCGDWDNDFHTCRVYLQHEELQWYIEQLTKAKEIIKKFSEFVNNENEYDPEHPQEHTDLWNKLCEEAEQFLKETGK